MLQRYLLRFFEENAEFDIRILIIMHNDIGIQEQKN